MRKFEENVASQPLMENIRKFRIFLADDDFDDLEFFRFLFDGHPDFEIVGTVSCGSDIINHINAMDNHSYPDILLTDYMMPIISGTDAVRHLLKNKTAPEMEIFIITGNDNPALRAEFEQVDRVSFLKKPQTLVDYNDLPNDILQKLHAVNNYRV